LKASPGERWPAAIPLWTSLAGSIATTSLGATIRDLFSLSRGRRWREGLVDAWSVFSRADPPAWLLIIGALTDLWPLVADSALAKGLLRSLWPTGPDAVCGVGAVGIAVLPLFAVVFVISPSSGAPVSETCALEGMMAGSITARMACWAGCWTGCVV
jgi:hypothetical protein